MECLRSITPLAHLILPNPAFVPRSAQNRTHKVAHKMHCLVASPVVQLQGSPQTSFPKTYSPYFSTGRRIGLSLDTREVAGSNPAFGSSLRSPSFGSASQNALARRSAKRVGGRSSSVVEHVNSQFVSYPSVSHAEFGFGKISTTPSNHYETRHAQSGH